MDGREAMAYAHLSHLTSQAAYYKLDQCYSPLDIRSKFPDASPHTTVSFSSSSSRHESPEGDEPSSSNITTDSKWPMESAPSTIAIPGSLLYTSTSASSSAQSPVSSVRSDTEDALPDESTQSRRKGRKQFKPLRCKTDRDMVAEQICPEVTSADSLPADSTDVQDPEPRDNLQSEEHGGEQGEMDRNSPTSSQLVEGPAARFFPVGPSGVRIFNPDAYCQLCDREFCNKYFLKTHMANKHAVFDPNSPPELPRSSGSLDGRRRRSGSAESFSAPTIHIPDAGPQLEAIFSSTMHLEPTSSSTGSGRAKKERGESPPTHRASSFPEQNDALNEQVLRQQLMQMCAQNMALQQMFNSGMAMPMAPFFPGMMAGLIPGFFPPQSLNSEQMMKPWQPESATSSEAQPEGVDNQEAALQCDICHKKLSSLNFLRNHLRKKHGVSQNKAAKASSPSPMPLPTDLLTMEESKRRKKEKRERRRQERKENERRWRQAQVTKEEQRHTSPMPTLGEATVDPRMMGTIPMPFPFANSPHPKPHFSNLQRLLQIPREVFRCGECCKEFAAAVFLEQHLRNEHSKAVTPPAESAVLDLSTPKSRHRHHDDPTPSSRKAKREAPNNSHAPFIFPTDEEASMGLPATSSEGNLDEFCVKCNRVYCSKYFLRTHLKKSHGMSTEEYLNEVATTHPELYQQYKGRAINEEGESPSRSNWCRYCKKEFCNKYFFKTHMIKTHQENVTQFLTSNRSSKKRSNGVQCDICKKNLCSKYFLRIHQRNAHGIVDPSLPAASSPTGSLPTMIGDMAHFGAEPMGQKDVRRSDSGEEDAEMMEEEAEGCLAVDFSGAPAIMSCAASDFPSASSPAVDMGFSESPLSSEGLKDQQEEEGNRQDW